MNSKRSLVPGETILLEIFPEVFKVRARRLSEKVLSLEGVRPRKMEEILAASDEDLRKLQLLRQMTYAQLDEIFKEENL